VLSDVDVGIEWLMKQRGATSAIERAELASALRLAKTRT
jgi:hypothetical protein